MREKITMIKTTYLAALAALFVLTTGCANLPPPNFSPTNVGILKTKAPADLKTISVSIAQPSEQTGKKVNLGMQAIQAPAWANITQHWKNGLENSLIRANAFDDGNEKKVAILVKVLQYWPPGGGFEMKTTVTAQYDILNTSDGSIVFTSTITSVGKVEAGYAFVGMTRAFESQNRAVQENIIQFIQQLETAKLDKPVFPGRQNKQP
jgi:hypothetical protein